MGKYFFRMDFNYGGESNIFLSKKVVKFHELRRYFWKFQQVGKKKTVNAVEEIYKVTDLKKGIA